jgi:3-hydroxyacyl-CoA dehydrogenase
VCVCGLLTHLSSLPPSLPPSLVQADYIGLDTCLFILEGWVKKYPNEPAFTVPSSLRALVKEGKLGRKSGEGFYVWQGDKKIKPAM